MMHACILYLKKFFIFALNVARSVSSYKVQCKPSTYWTSSLSILHNSVTQGKQATNNSSGEQSDEDDELEGEAETTNIDPSDTKRMRR